MKEMNIQIGTKLTMARKAVKLTQEQLAEKLGVTAQAVSSWERDEFLPDTKKIIMICYTLNLSPNTLLAEDDTDWKLKVTDQQPLLDRAIEFAAVKHAGQLRKGTKLPYFTHVMEAMEIVCRITDDEEIRAAAVLHDTLEDTETTKEELVQNFGQRVADLVAAESENKREDKPAEETWVTRKLETVEHMKTAPTEIRMIALGDKLSNVRAMTRDYRVVGERLWQRFNEKNPLYHGMYYGELANAFGEDETIRQTDVYREYVELCTDLFSKEYDGDGNLIEEDEENDLEAEKERGLDIRCIYANAMDEIRAEIPERTKVWCLILDRTEDTDLKQIQMMAMTLDALMRTEDTGFGDVHLQIVNEPGTDDVSWKRTADGYALHLCVESGRN